MASVAPDKYFTAINLNIVLLDENGDSIWKKPLPFPNFNIQEVHKTSDGAIAMCGYIASPSSDLIAFVKLDSLGNTVLTSIFNPQNNFSPLSFYPNPATNELFLNPGNMATEQNLFFTLTDIQGRTLMQQQYTAGTINVSTIPQGIYIATLKGKEKEVRGKVVIQR